MIQRNEQLVIVRGGGDIATGTISRLFRSGYPVVILEISTPSAIRRQVALSEAVYDGESKVEDVTCIKVESWEEAKEVLKEKKKDTSFSRSGVQYLKTGTSMGLSRCDFGKEKSGDKPPDGR